jgi:hypothetical protein
VFLISKEQTLELFEDQKGQSAMDCEVQRTSGLSFAGWFQLLSSFLYIYIAFKFIGLDSHSKNLTFFCIE